MTAITHQLFALLAALWIGIQYPVSMGPIVGILALISVMVGALTPDLDQPAANIWRRLLGGHTIGNIFQAFSGGHRHFTHSIVGILLIGLAWRWFIHELIQPDYVYQAMILFHAFMIGYISHPVADTLTDRGVPWFWPLPFHIKVPPGPEELRVTTDSIVERILIRGGIIICAVLLLSSYGSVAIRMFQ